MAADKGPKKKIVIKKKPGGGQKKPLKRAGQKKKASAAAEPEAAEEVAEQPEAPAPKTAEPAAERTATTDTQPVEADRFSFYCPYCGKTNQVAHQQAGQAIYCGHCENTVTVPPPLAEPTEKTQSQKVSLKFFCAICGQKLSATPAQAGTQTVCPACNSAITIPESQPAPPESSDAGAGDEPERGGTFKFHCPNCDKRFEAKKSWAGRPFVCPSCEKEVTVPEPPA